MRLILALSALLVSAAPAFASSGDCNGAGNCNSSDNHAITNGATGGNGGAGGAGGAGGNASNVNANTATGGSVRDSGNSFNVNANDVDTNIHNSNRSSNSNTNTSRSSSHASSDQSQGQSQDQGQSIVWENPRNPVSTAMAAALTASQETCAGSSSIGGQGVGFGLSLGTTWESESCNMRRNAALLNSIGNTGAAVELMCQDEGIRAAMKSAGTPCAADRPAGHAELEPMVAPAPTHLDVTMDPIP